MSANAETRISSDEAERRMPALKFIETEEIRALTIEAIQQLPEYFWEAPTTTVERFHNQYTRDDCGLWIHTLMVSTALERLLDSHRVPRIEITQMSQRHADSLRAAALLHDGRKYGTTRSDGEGSADDHEIQMADELESIGFDDTTVEAVREHMGPFEGYDGPVPSSPGSWLLHRADMVASDPFILPAVYDPPSELTDVHTDLPRYDDGDYSVTQSHPDQQSLSDFEDE